MMKQRGGLGLLPGCEIEACYFNTSKLTIETDWDSECQQMALIKKKKKIFRSNNTSFLSTQAHKEVSPGLSEPS